MVAMNNCWRVGKVVAWRKGFRLGNLGADVSRYKIAPVIAGAKSVQ